MKVNINDLQKVTTLLLSKLKENLGNEIELDNDLYWDISEDEIYNPYSEPTNISLGQLSSDLEEINRLKGDENPIPYDLKRVAMIIKALSVENQTSF